MLPLPLFPRFEGVCQYAAVYAFKDTEWARVCARGVSGEAFALEAATLGLASCWMSGNYRKSALDASPNERESLAAVIILGKPIDPGRRAQQEAKAAVHLLPG